MTGAIGATGGRTIAGACATRAGAGTTWGACGTGATGGATGTAVGGAPPGSCAGTWAGTLATFCGCPAGRSPSTMGSMRTHAARLFALCHVDDRSHALRGRPRLACRPQPQSQI